MSTIKEIAKRANVSVGTVDRVIHNRGRVAKETANRVKWIIEQLDYKPNVFAQQLRKSNNLTFGVLIPKPQIDNKYWQIPIRGMDKARKEIVPHQVTINYYFFDKYSERSIKNTTASIFNEKLDGLLIVPVSADLFTEFVKKIPKKLPYVFFDSLIPNASHLSYIGQDSFQSGVVAGRLMSMLVSGKKSVCVIKFLPREYHIDDRANGFQSFIHGNTELDLKVYEINTHNENHACTELIDRIIHENKNLNGIFVTNAYTHQIAECLEVSPLDKKIHIIGYDLLEENIKYLQNGMIDFLISQSPEIQGYEGIFTLYRHVVHKERVPKNKMMQIDIITKENFPYYQS